MDTRGEVLKNLASLKYRVTVNDFSKERLKSVFIFEKFMFRIAYRAWK
jgi:hypothetical protein